MSYYEFLRQIMELDKFMPEPNIEGYDYGINYLREGEVTLPLYNALTKNDKVKVFHSINDNKYITDINLKDLEVDKTLSSKYNIYYKFTFLASNRDPEKWLDPYSYDFYECVNKLINKVCTGSHILIILKDKHNKDYEARYIFNYQYPCQPHYPINIPEEHMILCKKLLNKLYD